MHDQRITLVHVTVQPLNNVHCNAAYTRACRTTDCTTGIAAGKCSSLACSIHGDMYAWGKAWHGELGTSTNRYLKYFALSLMN
jgi:hypothetical protein